MGNQTGPKVEQVRLEVEAAEEGRAFIALSKSYGPSADAICRTVVNAVEE